MAQVESNVRVWDLPVRVSHWGFALLVPAMWYTAEYSHWGWHKRFGLVLLGLLVFRFLCGCFGTRTARFVSFVKGPRAVLAYLRGHGASGVGHTPIGALSVVALLLAMSVQVGMGLFAGDPYDGATGPLNILVGVETADWLTNTHEWFYWVVLGLVALHLAAIAFYTLIRRKKLIVPMITGKRQSDAAQGNDPEAWGTTLAGMAMAVGVSIWVAYGAPPFGG
ncbi:MAG: cytochrome b/b6 domain-containing protein [Erythrobacter sp.]